MRTTLNPNGEAMTLAPLNLTDLDWPTDLAAERCLLGAILYRNGTLDTVRDVVRAEDFAFADNAALFEAAARMIDHGLEASPVTLFDWARRTFPDHDAGKWLASIVAEAVNLPALQAAKAIRYQAKRRRAIASFHKGIAEARAIGDDEERFDAAMRETAAETDAVTEADEASGFRPFVRALHEALTSAERAYQRKGQLAGLSTGFPEIDALVGGLNPGDLVIVAGRPAMGKTALATNVAYNVARAHRVEVHDGAATHVDGAVVAFFSLEMTAEQLATRITGAEAEVSPSRLRTGNLVSAEFDRVLGAAHVLEGLDLFIDDTPGLSLPQLRIRARRLRRTHGVGLIVVDYLQLVYGSVSSQRANRVNEVTEISRALKALAKELGVPVIALSQLSRAVEGRENKRPVLADLRDSGSIEQDADVVMFVYREEYYRKLANEDPGDAAGKAEVIVAKHRHMPTGTAMLHFDGPLTRFTSPASE